MHFYGQNTVIEKFLTKFIQKKKGTKSCTNCLQNKRYCKYFVENITPNKPFTGKDLCNPKK